MPFLIPAAGAVAGMSATTAGAIAAGTAVAGAALTAASTISAGNARKAESNYEAGQLKENAGQAQASGERAMLVQNRQTKLAESRAQAVAAASGGGALDPSVVDVEGNIAGEGAYRALSALYEGNSQATGMQNQAAATEFSGSQAQKASMISAGGGFLSSVGSTLSQKYSPLMGSPQSQNPFDYFSQSGGQGGYPAYNPPTGGL